ncbi:hypothetical protein CH358_14290 [Leptospira meyeri]|nr:hypothetical protein CH358_14290 [Leptospira meyeri]
MDHSGFIYNPTKWKGKTLKKSEWMIRTLTYISIDKVKDCVEFVQSKDSADEFINASDLQL